MAKEIERKGLPVALITALTHIAVAVGGKRIIPGTAIQYPVGDINRPLMAERRVRRRILQMALKSLTTQVEGPRVFHLE